MMKLFIFVPMWVFQLGKYIFVSGERSLITNTRQTLIYFCFTVVLRDFRAVQ